MMRRHHALLLSALALTACKESSSSPPATGVLGFVGFETRSEMELGVTSLNSLAVGDLDGDGDADLVALGAGGRLAVDLSQNGVFTTGQLLQIGGRTTQIRLADMDNDGDLDVLALSSVTASIEMATNDGMGDLAPVQPLAVGAAAVDFAIGDVDADGALDVVVASAGRSDLLWFAGVGDGTFRSPVALPLTRGDRVIGITIGDWNGDERADLAVCDVDNDRVVMLLGDAAGVPTKEVIVAVGQTPFALSSGDVSGDGRDDLAVSALGAQSIDVIENRGGDRFAVVNTLASDGEPGQSTIGDVTGDGIADLVVCVINRRAVAIYEGGASGVSTTPIQIASTASPMKPLIADVNGDRINDLVVGGRGIERVNVYTGRNGAPAGSRLHEIPSIDSPELCAAADFDQDGRVDVAAAGFRSSVVTFMRSEADALGHPVLTRTGAVDLGRLVQNLVAADVDGDGRTDLVAALDGGIRILANDSENGNLSFNRFPADPGVLIAVGAGPFELTVADLTGDGVKDIAVAYHVEDKVALLRGRPDLPFNYELRQETPLPGDPLGMASGDFDGDGDLEVAVTRIAASVVTILEVTDAGLQPTVDTPVGQGPNYLRTADFNGDQITDIVVSNGVSDSITVLIPDASGFRRQDLPAGQLPTALLTEDLNRDGFADVMVASLAGADFRVLLGDGSGGFAQALIFPGVYSAVTAAFADLDGDGMQDLLIGSLFSERLASFRNVSRVQ